MRLTPILRVPPRSKSPSPTPALVVESDPELAITLEKLLAELGLVTIVCDDGLTAVRLLKTFSPQVVVTNVRLPRVSGLQVIRAVRASSTVRSTRHATLIAIGAREARADLAKARALGASGCITTPTSPATLGASLRALVRLPRSWVRVPSRLVRAPAERRTRMLVEQG